MDELSALLSEIGQGPRDVLSTRSRVYRERRDEIDQMMDAELIEAMVGEPTLLRRPILVADSGFVVGSKKADLEGFASAIAQDKG